MDNAVGKMFSVSKDDVLIDGRGEVEAVPSEETVSTKTQIGIPKMAKEPKLIGVNIPRKRHAVEPCFRLLLPNRTTRVLTVSDASVSRQGHSVSGDPSTVSSQLCYYPYSGMLLDNQRHRVTFLFSFAVHAF
jgi:hypothetical protein